MKDERRRILLMGSRAKITNLPIEEVSMLAQGSLPAYGYNPGDFIELLAGKVTVEDGRLEQCLTWLSSYLASTDITACVNTMTYGSLKEIFQIFKKRKGSRLEDGHGWFMVHQILPPGGRGQRPETLMVGPEKQCLLEGNDGLIIIDDGGCPPAIAREMKRKNPGAWIIALGISAAHWEEWAQEFGRKFILFCRLSDLETTRMEMDSAIVWESVVAMALRALKSPEVGLWGQEKNAFQCHVVVEMFPHGILYTGPGHTMFRHREKTLPERTSIRGRGSVPCYDTLTLAMLAVDCIRLGYAPLTRCYFYDFSKRTLLNWKLLNENGYYFTDSLEFPNLDFSSIYPGGQPCSFMDTGRDPCFFELPAFSQEFERNLEIVSCQDWNQERKAAVRSFLASYSSASSGIGSGKEQERKLGYIGVILSVLKDLKEEVNHKSGFSGLRLFQVGALRTTDPAEIAPVVTLQGVMDSYVSKESYKRPLCLGVFGPPGSGKSFAVVEVARVISRKIENNPFEFFEFNLTQFSGPEEINAAIDLVRASVAKGKVPIAFWDEFDCRYDGNEFGYLRYFLPSMQDGVTYVHGIPHYIGRSIFVFAGGVKESWEQMEKLRSQDDWEAMQLVKTLKIPDFMSRLRVVIDIDGIDVADDLLRDSASDEELEELRRILLKRAFIIAHQMNSHWKKAARKTSGLLLRLLIAKYKFGARSIEAVIEASHAVDRLVYGLPELITPPGARIHAAWRVELERRIDRVRKEFGMRGVW
ncbi:MAG TPA: ATPase [Thermodesulfobacteriaceae bacterium]|nr:ATPase [Thermodesulfobacteriaceae bacterium]